MPESSVQRERPRSRERELEFGPSGNPRTVYSSWAHSIRPGGRGPGGRWLLDQAPEEMAELAEWFVGLEPLARLAHVWVSAVVYAAEFGTGFTTGDLARALNVVAERLHGFGFSDEEVQTMLAQKKQLSQAAATPGTITPLDGEQEAEDFTPPQQQPRTRAEPEHAEAAARHGLRPCGCVNKGRHRQGCPAARRPADKTTPAAGTLRPVSPVQAPVVSRRGAESAESAEKKKPSPPEEEQQQRVELAKAYRYAHDLMQQHVKAIERVVAEMKASVQVFGELLRKEGGR